MQPLQKRSLGKLLLEDILEGHGVSGKLANALAQLLNSHLVLVEVESEESLVLEVRLALDVGRGGLRGVELLGDGFGAVHELLEEIGLREGVSKAKQKTGGILVPETGGGGGFKTYRDGEVVASSELSNLTGAAERGAHDNGLVAKLLVVLVDALDGGDARVLLLGVLLLVVGLEPVEDAADEGGDEVGAGLGGANSLR